MQVGRQSWVREASRRLPSGLERREDNRIHTVMRVAMVRRDHDVGLWRVRNISDSGMMLTTQVPVDPRRGADDRPFRHGLDRRPRDLVGRRALRGGLRPAGRLRGVARGAGRRAEGAALPPAAPARSPPAPSLIATRACTRSGSSTFPRAAPASPMTAAFAPAWRSSSISTRGEEHRGVIRWSQDGRAGLYLLEPIPCARLESANRL